MASILAVGWGGLAAVAIGAVLGAWLRLWFGMLWNPLFAPLPMGTLAANLLGGLIIGGSLAWFARHPEVDPAWRLFLVTGFLGALTTFSTFSGESLQLLMTGRALWALAHSAVHLLGCLASAALGYWLLR
jgi:fluoride exporter